MTVAPSQHVLITRPEPDASAFAAMCAANGMSPILAPLMEIEIKRRPADLEGVGALAFTSANGVRAFAANSTIRKQIVFAVGRATADAARKEGFAEIRIAAGDVAALARTIADARAEIDGAVLHVAGSDRAGDLIAALDGHGVPAQRAVLYKARAVDVLPLAARTALEARPPVQWAALFSPRTAALFVSLVRDAGLEDRLGGVRAACLSAAVADAAREVVWGSRDVAAEHTAESMVALMRDDDAAPTDCGARG